MANAEHCIAFLDVGTQFLFNNFLAFLVAEFVGKFCLKLSEIKKKVAFTLFPETDAFP